MVQGNNFYAIPLHSFNLEPVSGVSDFFTLKICFSKILIFRFDSLFIQSVLLDMEISDIKSLNCGSGLLEIHLPQYNISFIDSMRYIPGSLKKMAQRFELPIKKGSRLRFFINISDSIILVHDEEKLMKNLRQKSVAW